MSVIHYNYDEIVEKLNGCCYHRNDRFFVPWQISDIEYGYHKTYCYTEYKYYDLCVSCENILKELNFFQGGVREIIDEVQKLRQELDEVKHKLSNISL